MSQPMTVVLEADTLTLIRWSLLQRLDEDLGTVKAFTEDALRGDNKPVALREGRMWSRHLLDTLNALDAVGWPVDDDREEAADAGSA
jgi:hypothetical protein